MGTEKFKIPFIFFALVIFQLSIFSGVNVASAASDDQDIEILIENFNAQDVNVKADSVKALVEAGEPAVKPLIQALSSKDPEIRENAAITLGKIKDERAIDPLIKLLTDEEWEVESAATNALVEIGKPAVEPLIKILQDENEDSFLQVKAIAVLAGIKDERAIQPMIQALKEEPELDADLGYNLSLMGESAVEPLIQALDDEDPKVRARAAEALGRIGDKRAVGPLTDALDDKDEMVRTFAKLGLENIEAQHENPLIATYGKEREFYIEDQRRLWFDQLNKICDLAKDSMEPYMYSKGGPVISYGWRIENRIGVGILEGSEVNNSTLDNIYNVFDRAGKEIGVNDVPVIFSYTEFPVDEEILPKLAEDIEKIEEPVEAEETNKTEGSRENVRMPVSTPGLRIIFVLGVLISACVVNRH
ncbi:HEAT repeat domain-containing protein [Methanosarcina sp. UBA5]|uniref:HEAT repeat domain-containing protein n=1 Tax=Methanosarcina sp. UBA5 TaxID=1915593 RepID=UPI0025D81E0B|nr:HEAT repeat domain-containing protein [Methanosarcina sp. UBA5]